MLPVALHGLSELAPPRRGLQFGRLPAAHLRPSSLERCRDSNEECSTWAAAGECEANPGFMVANCLQSCMTCDELVLRNRTRVEKRERRRGGSCYDDSPDCAERASAGACHNGSRAPVECAWSCHVCGFTALATEAYECVDKHEACAGWAKSGECARNPGFMAGDCAKSCALCDRRGEICARPAGTTPTVTPGAIGANARRILREFPQYSPRAISRPGLENEPSYPGRVPQAVRAGRSVLPWVLTLANFLSDEEVDAFIAGCRAHFERSLAGDKLSPVRTSRQCWCADNECAASPLTKLVEARVQNLTATPTTLHMEPFQASGGQYEEGQFYKVHHDQNSGWFTPQGVRIYTFFMYLSTPDEGGGTHFADLGLTVPAVKGTAVLWPSVTDADPTADEPYTNHEGLPPARGVKYAANAWIHQYDYRSPAKRNCLLAHRNTHAPIIDEDDDGKWP